ncbi:MAG TPA: pectinesterase family protein [Chitinophagaceae bacterium]|nr:pectinesterase family protein [Chitinophagaceae bacterium]
MYGSKKIVFCMLSFLLTTAVLPAQQTSNSISITVDINGKGPFTSIQAAINSLPDTASSMRYIFVKKGVYKEKLYIEKKLVTLQGEDRETTIITQAIARDYWRCLHNEDWGVATMNIDANDITLKNLTIINSYGFDVKNDTTVACPLDTTARQQTISPGGHQMALRTMNATRLRAINCHFTAYAGDTVSPWNVDNGMYYFKDCIMEGGVDFYCPRGWAFAENCQFVAHTGTASIWHDGSLHEASKTVLKNCSFSGFEGFNLGRYHKDAQFYLINCSFAANMANRAIYLVPTNNSIRWGQRIYYFNCHRKGTDFPWYADNLNTAPGAPHAADINASWVFAGKWNPAQ